MRNLFGQILPLVLKHEGGYANHPKDPGGATMKGVTQATYSSWRRRSGKPERSVKNITEAELRAIYRRDYWDKVKGDSLFAGVDYATFDAAVNSGPGRGARWLQKAVGAKADGAVGPNTLKAMKTTTLSPAKIVKAICRTRRSFLQSLRTWSTFGRGWSRRVADVEAEGVRMAMEHAGQTPLETADDAERESAKAEAKAQQNAKGAAGTGAGGVAGGGAAAVDPGVIPDQVVPYLGAGLFIIVAIGVVLFLFRAHQERERSKAFKRSAKAAQRRERAEEDDD